LKDGGVSTVAYRFVVQDPWRGVKDKEVEVRTGYGGGDCGYVFEFGKSYLIYSWGGNAQPLRTGICSRTRSLATASEDVEYHRSLSQLSAGATVNGFLQYFEEDLANYRSKGQGGMPGVLITAEGVGTPATATTDSKGRYEIRGLQPGSYQIRALVPETFSRKRAQRTITLTDAHACARVSFTVVPDGRLTGTILNAQGKPATQVSVFAESLDSPGESQYFKRETETDDSGRYEFTELPRRQYLISVNVVAPEGSPKPYRPAFHPGEFKRESATVAELDFGERRQLPNFRLPADPADCIVRGRVLSSDGRRPTKPSVVVADSVKGYEYTVPVAEDGMFSFRALKGMTYAIYAESELSNPSESDDRTTEPARSTVVRIIASEESHPVDLILDVSIRK
jgi:hypothetical protein